MKGPFTLVMTAALAAASASTVRAQEGFDVHNFDVVPSVSSSYLTLQQARVLESAHWEFGLFFDYANDPLVYAPAGGDRSDKIVANTVTAHLLGAIGIANRLELGFDVPLILVQDSDVATLDMFDGGAGFGIGDVRLVPEVLFFGPRDADAAGPSMSLAVDTWLPTGDEDALQGGGFRVRPRLAFDFAFGEIARIGINAGYFIRPRATFANVEIDDAVSYGVAADVALGSEHEWHIVPEVRGETVVGADEFDTEESPLEALLGLKYVTNGVSVTVGGGTGIVNGAGVPDFRAFAGVTVFRREREFVETPLEDFPDFQRFRDDCPDAEEDEDGFQDADGCPDPDNDQDTILDIDDACPDSPEDFDGFADGDGCPDPDHDEDGLLEDADACPDQAEDFDGFQDDDGCPDDDNDGDGIPDVDDGCPDEAEDVDGDQDEDGCADRSATVYCDFIEVDGKVDFASDSAELDAAATRVLDQVVHALTEHPEILVVEVGGHTDNVGDWEYNRDLSQRRVDAVMDYLVEAGVAPERMTAVGYGEDIPIDTNDDEIGRANNRRVEFVIVERSDECTF